MNNVLVIGATFTLRGDLPINRLSFGAMRIIAQPAWGQPTGRPAMLALLRWVVELGVNFIDTADMHGPFSEKRTSFTPLAFRHAG